MRNFCRRISLPLLVLLATAGGPGQPAARAGHFRVWPFLPGAYPYSYYYYAQPYPFYPSYYLPPYWPSPYPYAAYTFSSNADPYGGYLKGAAELTNAQGQYLKNVQEAYLLREQVRAKEIENRRRTLEQWQWERSNLPTPAEERERAQREQLRKSLNEPPATEIWSGQALNDILASLQELRSRGLEGPAVPLAAETLRRINVTPGKGPAAPSILKQARLNWPAGLRTLPPENETRAILAQVEGLLAEAKRQALARGRVEPTITRELEKNVEALLTSLRGQVTEMSFSGYTEGKRFLQALDDAVKVLQQPDAGDYLNGKYAARGETVKELVQYMSEAGLRFAPAGAGEEAAATALHRALVQYHQGTIKQPPR
jgi:hypothetical protein